MKSHVTCFLCFVAVSAFAAGPLENAELFAVTDRPALSYAPGEKMVFTFAVTNARPFDAGAYTVAWTRTGDDGRTEKGRVPLVFGGTFAVETSLDVPGFVRLYAEAQDAAGKPVMFEKPGNGAYRSLFCDCGAAVRPDRIEEVPEPADFDTFWAKRRARLAKVPLKADLKACPSDDPAVKIWQVSVACAGPRPVTGHLTVPAAPGRYPAEIAFDGYSTYPPAHERAPKSGPKDRLRLHINAHGYELGREDEYYEEFYRSIMSGGHTYAKDSDWQNRDPETAYFSGMTYRVMRAVEYLASRPEWDGRSLTAVGVSQGGLQTIWAAALDHRVTVALPGVPWCCDMAGTEKGRLRGSWYVKGTPALGYFDPIYMARRIPATCRVKITRAGLGDYTCPPSGVALLWKNLRCPAEIVWEQCSTHGFTRPRTHETFVFRKGPEE